MSSTKAATSSAMATAVARLATPRERARRSMRAALSVSFALAPLSSFLLAGCGSPDGQGPSDEAVGSAQSAVTVCGQDTVHGIDVSHHQNQVDWTAVRAAGIDFAFAKATEGTTFVDPYFAANWAGMKSAGLIRGAYHFFHPAQDPQAQLDFTLNTIGALGAGDLPLALDLETTDNLSTSAIVSAATKFMEAAQAATGKTPILYVGHKFLSDFSAFSAYPVWDADPNVSCADLPSAWSSWTIWQRSWTGSVGGVSPVDLDTFNGTLAQLTQLAGGGANPQPDAGGDGGSGGPHDAGRANDDGGTTTTPHPSDGTPDGGTGQNPDRNAPLAGDAGDAPEFAANNNGGCSASRSTGASGSAFGASLVAALGLSVRRRRRGRA